MKVKLFLVACLLLGTHILNAQLIPTTAVSNMPVVTFSDLGANREDFTILNTISAKAGVISDNNRKSRKIQEENNEFSITYNIIKIDGKRYLDYEDCEGVMRLGFLGGTAIYNSDANYMTGEEAVRRLALYRLINLAKEYGADALFEPTIITTATSKKNTIYYTTEASAKLIKIKND